MFISRLENAKQLQELHIESQKIPFGESLCFEPRSAFALSMCLKVLNISDDNITSLKNLTAFRELNTLEAKNNFLNDMDDLIRTISTLISLKDLSLQGNPVTQSYRYRENLIANSILLGNLDGKIVTNICRNFMKKFKIKNNRHVKKEIKTPLANDISSFLNLPPAFKRSISRAIFQHPGSQLSLTITPELIGSQQVFPPWKHPAFGIRNIKDNHT
ncbi:protein phosphatase 1 regulatory subunit 42-like [Nylanderia fulva]|uniref:protein phosphatase 1 regulatory subunit 42-like n=1 Tax=Nylanderia fulva TaxID=613905 RepID=UPI0010FAEBBB|nr:protein phosphatase 1 regulatory subunit 42-like [Nylanderia fulva]